jgi:protein ImuB
VLLRLVTKATYARRLELPSPMRDVRTLRTLALLDLESHPPDAAIDRVEIVIDPTPGRVLQHTLFTRAQPTPEQLSTLLARLHALMGQDRVGAPVAVDSYRPGAFAMAAFETDHQRIGGRGPAVGRLSSDPRSPIPDHRSPTTDPRSPTADPRSPTADPRSIVSALRRCRHPVPARVAVAEGRPARVTTDRRGFAGGIVVQCVGPWRTSGNWWAGEAGLSCWNRDEWDVALNDGAVYRIFQDRDTEAWFIEAIVD